MPRRIMWLIGGLLLVAWAIAAATPGSAAPDTHRLLDLTVTTTPPTPTSPPGTPSATPPPGTPSATTPPGTPSATPKHRTPEPHPEPSPTPTATPSPTGDPRVDKSADPSSGFPGDKITFTIVVRNNASIPATNVEVDDSVPGQFEIQGATTSQGTIEVNGQHIHAVIGTLPPGGSATIRISTVIRADAAPGQVDNVTIMTNDTPGDDLSNNTSTTTVTIEGPGPTPTPPAPARLPPTSGQAPWLAPLALAALVALVAGLGLRMRRRLG
jgi:uncharacterized repeat protein (TIGR01451 family)